jgi:hypothetical protein
MNGNSNNKTIGRGRARVALVSDRFESNADILPKATTVERIDLNNNRETNV